MDDDGDDGGGGGGGSCVYMYIVYAHDKEWIAGGGPGGAIRGGS